MNIGETKEEFRRDVKSPNYEILETKKLHLNVSRIKANIDGMECHFGYSYQTIVWFAVDGYSFTTNRTYSISTQKHKGQMGVYGEMKYNLDIPEKLFRYLLNETLSGVEFKLENIKKFVKENEIKVIRTQERTINEDVFSYLANHEFIKIGYNLVPRRIKEIIRGKTWNQDKVFINFKDNLHKLITINTYKTPNPDNVWSINRTYRYSGKDKIYKNLSFLNQIDLENISEVI